MGLDACQIPKKSGRCTMMASTVMSISALYRLVFREPGYSNTAPRRCQIVASRALRAHPFPNSSLVNCSPSIPCALTGVKSSPGT